MLIILSKSPSTGNYDLIIEMAAKAVGRGEKVAVLHIQDSCIAIILDEYCQRFVKAGIDAYALKDDCQTRGLLKKVRQDVKVIDCGEWVRLLMEEHNRIISWTT